MAFGAKRRRGRAGGISKSHKRTKSLKKIVKEIIQQDAELKVLDTLIPLTQVSKTGTALNGGTGAFGDTIHLLAESTTPFGRIGRKVVLKKIMFRFTLELPSTAAAADGADSLRIMVVWDKATAGTIINETQLLSGATPDINAFNNLDFKGRYVTLMDKIYTIHADASFSASTIYNTRAITFYKEVNIPLEFTESAGSIVENRINSVQIFAISERAKIFVKGVTRIRYLDM